MQFRRWKESGPAASSRSKTEVPNIQRTRPRTYGTKNNENLEEKRKDPSKVMEKANQIVM